MVKQIRYLPKHLSLDRKNERVTLEEEHIPVGDYVRAPGDVPKILLIPNLSRGHGQVRGGVTGRGRGRGVVIEIIGAPSGQGSSDSHHGRAQGRRRGRTTNMITREELVDEIARAINATLPNLVA
uniref:Uncharacterized protein n=1 Tax=Lactuca sativa TaxID=4236 RepID=A0A9R1VC49_LACSA|nr:hypothetical protein LSAT_V11C600337000 [Lactuca sativa]